MVAPVYYLQPQLSLRAVLQADLKAMAEGEPVLVSWSGSMFEYLMPMLVMPT